MFYMGKRVSSFSHSVNSMTLLKTSSHNTHCCRDPGRCLQTQPNYNKCRGDLPASYTHRSVESGFWHADVVEKDKQQMRGAKGSC